ncbi:MAG: hypothetical protein KC549_08610 [Myxococcales bacterium]|nr:hypothetical protein [Myxococcales bacterium]MCB9550021.1 hypothetical protein [Myxococcales bacterium]
MQSHADARFACPRCFHLVKADVVFHLHAPPPAPPPAARRAAWVVIALGVAIMGAALVALRQPAPPLDPVVIAVGVP